jgi:endonuclease-3
MTLAPAEIMDRLAALYGWPRHLPSGDAVGELILTVLSQNTADTNSGRAFTQMLRRYPSWDAIAFAPPDELVETIRAGGLAQQKAPRIQAILRAIRERQEGWDLAFLASVPLDEARAWLRALPGVGPKTAACVLLFSLGRPAMPVDTHVERVAKRLGLIAAKTTAEQAHDRLEALVPPESYYPFHMLLIKHGRRICDARRPDCGRCPLEPDCPASVLREPARGQVEAPGHASSVTAAASSSGAAAAAPPKRPSRRRAANDSNTPASASASPATVTTR